MKQPLAAAAASLLLGSGLMVTTASTASADVICRGTFTARTDQDIVVPAGASCTVRSPYVDGNIKAYRGSRLFVFNTVVSGNIQAEGHYSVYVQQSRIDGNIQLESGSHATLLSNQLDGDIQLFSNRGEQRVFRNYMDGNLQCKSNVPRPTGSSNVARGNIEDQCRNMVRNSIIDSKQSGTLRSSGGRVTLDGYLKAYSTYGTLTTLPAGQKLRVEVRYPGGRWTYIGNTGGTRAGSGYYWVQIGRRAGAEVRLGWISPYTGIASAWKWVGRMA